MSVLLVGTLIMEWLGDGEVGRGGAKGSMQVPGCQADNPEHDPEDGEFERGMVASRLRREDQASYQGHRKRDPPVKAARLGRICRRP